MGKFLEVFAACCCVLCLTVSGGIVVLASLFGDLSGEALFVGAAVTLVTAGVRFIEDQDRTKALRYLVLGEVVTILSLGVPFSFGEGDGGLSYLLIGSAATFVAWMFLRLVRRYHVGTTTG